MVYFFRIIENSFSVKVRSRGQVMKMDIRLLALYFVLGGTVVAAVTYFGSQGKGLLAAFISMLPTVSLITLCSVYFSSGGESAVSYFKSMLVVLPAWILYVVAQILLLPRLGLAPTLITGLIIYIGGVWLISRFVHWA
jgi:uncharacterized membrane protein (GlpM family)